jgi:hypothetical protein
MRRLLSLILLASLTGCASSFDVTEIPSTLPPGGEVSGVPFRVLKTFQATLYMRTDKGWEPVSTPTQSLTVTVPDPGHLYALGLTGDVLANPTYEVGLNPDGTLEHVAVGSAQQGTAALTELGTQINGAATAKTAGATAQKTAANTQAGLVITAQKGKTAADEAELAYQTALADSTQTALQVLKAKDAAIAAKLDANEAARQAGLPLPFSDVSS